MTDEETGSYLALEDQVDGTTPTESPPTETPAETPAASEAVAEIPATPVEDEDADLEAAAVEDRITRERMIPVGVVKEWRDKAKARKAEAEALGAKVKDLEAKAAEADQVAEIARQWQAYAQQLAAQQEPPRPSPDPREAERTAERQAAQRTRAEVIAQLAELYTPEGKPDVERGLKLLAVQEELAREQVAAMVTPLRRENAQTKAQANRAAIQAHLAKAGKPINTQLFDHLWTHLTPELTANQEVAAVAAAAAIGWPLLFGQEAPAQVQAAVQQAAAQAPRSPVVVTEPVQQRFPQAPRLSGHVARLAKQFKLTPEDVEKKYGRQPDRPYVVLANDLDEG